MIQKIIIYLLTLTFLASKCFAAAAIVPKPNKTAPSAYDSNNSTRLMAATLLLSNEEYTAAYEALKRLSISSSDEADRQNLLGFSARKLGMLSLAKEHYEQALNIDASHLGALEYQGKLFLLLGEIDNAKRNLQMLKAKCFIICPKEYELLLKEVEKLE